MACENQFRHVCLKDLDNYIKRDSYFADFTDDEKAIIRNNLGIVSGSDPEYNPMLVLSDYESIYSAMKAGTLKVGYIYVILDFQSLYLDKDGTFCGETFMPSQKYWIFLNPTSTSSFDPRVRLSQPDIKASTAHQWTVEYDITPVNFLNGRHSKGTITYLKDSNNNYAYYDFKNIKFKKSVSELAEFPKTYTSDTYFYTFDNNGIDGSEHGWNNNHLDKGAVRNIFLGDTQNVWLLADCHDNVFLDACKNSEFGFGTYNNMFKVPVIDCKGAVHDKTLLEELLEPCFKQLGILGQDQILIYLDQETQTFLIKRL